MVKNQFAISSTGKLGRGPLGVSRGAYTWCVHTNVNMPCGKICGETFPPILLHQHPHPRTLFQLFLLPPDYYVKLFELFPLFFFFFLKLDKLCIFTLVLNLYFKFVNFEKILFRWILIILLSNILLYFSLVSLISWDSAELKNHRDKTRF